MANSDVLDTATDLAINELKRRLEDTPELFPDHVLGKLVADLEKRAERKAKEQEAVEREESKPFDLLDELDTLPYARAMVLAKKEMERLGAGIVELREYLDAREKQETAEVPVHEVR